MRRDILILPIIGLLVFNCLNAQAQIRKTISGYVTEKGSKELLIGVNVYLPYKKVGTTTNNFGFYSLTLSRDDTSTIVFSFVGFNSQIFRFNTKKDIQLNIEFESNLILNEVEITSGKALGVRQSVQLSEIDISVSQIKSVPGLLGEKDLIKTIQLMPGVQKGSEGNNGIYVRGGAPDQNLIIVDDATLYNAFHLFGFFSLFNGDAVKSVTLTKGGFPARYGGRLSSVIDISLKDGSKEKFHGEGGIGILTSRLTLEGPLIKNKSSFIISGRRTYADLFIKPFLPENQKGSYYFYDLNAKLNFDFGRKNKIYISGYLGDDVFSHETRIPFTYNSYSTDKGGFDWGSKIASIRWNHLFNHNLFANASLIYSKYRFVLTTNTNNSDGTYELNYSSKINDFTFKYDWDFLLKNGHSVKFGLISTAHKFSPSAIVIKDYFNFNNTSTVEDINVLESGFYIEDLFKPNSKLALNGGIRLSHYRHPNKNYFYPEPRFSTSYILTDNFQIKASYALMNQFVHLVSNSGVNLPSDLWIPATSQIAPQRSEQIAGGISREIASKRATLSIEGFYKRMKNMVAYKDGTSFLLVNDSLIVNQIEKVDWESNIVQGKGWSYGGELLLQKKLGKFTGWIGYTLSWTRQQFDSLNHGKKFFARHDRRHDISVVGVYNLNKKITLSFTWVYGTGNAITLPQREYKPQGHKIGNKEYFYDYKDHESQNRSLAKDYGSRNSFRMAPYHRLDLGIKFNKKKKWGERTWEISVFNAYNRRNPFYYKIAKSYDERTETQKTYLKQVTLFPIIPSLTYSFKF